MTLHSTSPKQQRLILQHYYNRRFPLKSSFFKCADAKQILERQVIFEDLSQVESQLCYCKTTTMTYELDNVAGYIIKTNCLRPSAKDQGITWVFLVLHHLVHFLLKINLSEKISPFLGIEPGLSCSPDQHSINLAMAILIQIVGKLFI